MIAADTRATELGTLRGGTPRFVLNGRPLPPGMSGGVTCLGSASAALGASSVNSFLGALLQRPLH